MSLTSPISRASVATNNPHSPLGSRGNRRSSGGNYVSMSKDEALEEIRSEYVTYTVHIPPTPDNQSVSASQNSGFEESRNYTIPEKSFITGTFFTGGFNSVTRGHVIECSMNQPKLLKAGLICGMKGCDEKAIKGSRLPCDCGFKICRVCFLDSVGNGGGRCPECKEPYKDCSEEEKEEAGSEAEDQAFPLPSMAEAKVDKRLSLVKSFKAQSHPPDFDHTHWLFDTKGTYGYGNAVWPKDSYGIGWVGGFKHPPDFGERCRRPLTRKSLFLLQF